MERCARCLSLGGFAARPGIVRNPDIFTQIEEGELPSSPSLSACCRPPRIEAQVQADLLRADLPYFVCIDSCVTGTVTKHLADELSPPSSVTVSMNSSSSEPEVGSGAVKVVLEAVGSERVTGLPLS